MAPVAGFEIEGRTKFDARLNPAPSNHRGFHHGIGSEFNRFKEIIMVVRRIADFTDTGRE